MRKHGEFKISLSHPRGGKTLNSTTSGRESMSGGGGGERGVLNVGCVKCGGMVRPLVHGICN